MHQESMGGDRNAADDSVAAVLNCGVLWSSESDFNAWD